MKYNTYLYIPGNNRPVKLPCDPIPMDEGECLANDLLDNQWLSGVVPIFWPVDLKMPKRLKKASKRKVGAK